MARLLLLHGFASSPRAWDLVRPALEREHEVLAPPLVHGDVEAVLAGVEDALGAAGWETAHLVGNSLGGYIALRLAARGRARSVVAFAPGGGWAPGDPDITALFAAQETAPETLRVTERPVPPEVAAQMVADARAWDAPALVPLARAYDWPLDPERITCPVRIVWGTADRLLPWPSAAVRLRAALPHADWVELDGVGHAPQLEAPLEAAQLVLGFV